MNKVTFNNIENYVLFKENDEDKKLEKQNDISALAPPLLITTLHTALNQSLYYDEVALNCNR